MPASYVPSFMSELPSEMNFGERAFNLAWKLLGLTLMFFHCLRCDQNIAREEGHDSDNHFYDPL